jgi:3-methyladenine DNA glycosylase AlkD
MTNSDLEMTMLQLANPDKAKILQRFFKTGKGEYGEGDKFLGIVVPEIRKIVKQFSALSITEIVKAIRNPYHEIRLTGLLILVYQFKHGDVNVRKSIYEIYLQNRKFINNWDLVDLTAPNIVGEYLLDQDKIILDHLAKSKNLWDRRISILSTYSFIKKGSSREIFQIADILLSDDQDLIQKAVGWMLRETGKRISVNIECEYLDSRYQKMPRTMLRYAIERFPDKLREHYLSKKT